MFGLVNTAGGYHQPSVAVLPLHSIPLFFWIFLFLLRIPPLCIFSFSPLLRLCSYCSSLPLCLIPLFTIMYDGVRPLIFCFLILFFPFIFHLWKRMILFVTFSFSLPLPPTVLSCLYSRLLHFILPFSFCHLLFIQRNKKLLSAMSLQRKVVMQGLWQREEDIWCNTQSNEEQNYFD